MFPSINHLSIRSFEGVLYKKTKLNHKKYWAVVVGQRLLLSHNGYDNSNNNKRKTKILKVNKEIELHDYDVSIAAPSGGKIELKLVCPGKKTCLFYCKDKCEAESWQKVGWWSAVVGGWMMVVFN